MTIKGMDISYWQGNVDFARVAADGIKFAILRFIDKTSNRVVYFEKQGREVDPSPKPSS